VVADVSDGSGVPEPPRPDPGGTARPARRTRSVGAPGTARSLCAVRRRDSAVAERVRCRGDDDAAIDLSGGARAGAAAADPPAWCCSGSPCSWSPACASRSCRCGSS
jgi:hypothetical protein